MYCSETAKSDCDSLAIFQQAYFERNPNLPRKKYSDRSKRFATNGNMFRTSAREFGTGLKNGHLKDGYICEQSFQMGPDYETLQIGLVHSRGLYQHGDTSAGARHHRDQSKKCDWLRYEIYGARFEPNHIQDLIHRIAPLKRTSEKPRDSRVGSSLNNRQMLQGDSDHFNDRRFQPVRTNRQKPFHRQRHQA